MTTRIIKIELTPEQMSMVLSALDRAGLHAKEEANRLHLLLQHRAAERAQQQADRLYQLLKEIKSGVAGMDLSGHY